MGATACALSLALAWSYGCVNEPRFRCGRLTGFRVLDWWSVIPIVLASVAAVSGLVLRFFHSIDSGRYRFARVLSTVCGTLVLLTAGVMRTHPWTTEAPGGEPAGWSFGIGIPVLALGGMLVVLGAILSPARVSAASGDA